MKLALLASGRLRERYAQLGAEEFAKRIARLAPFDIIEAPESRGAAEEETGRRLLARVKEGDRVVLLSERGRAMTSEDLAKRIGKALNSGRGRLLFVIGGPYGVGAELEGRADELLSLGPMTLPHELARVVLLEQIYRALTILKGRSYHHG
ncbi:MAG: 23S rRNA (pseudouridine(1915)-N(3))-methyltransferase RlmH [Planctomycetota bacterium]|jgi:23S rRNA (pseudouridine1915-N3)-methyltransferase